MDVCRRNLFEDMATHTLSSQHAIDRTRAMLKSVSTLLIIMLSSRLGGCLKNSKACREATTHALRHPKQYRLSTTSENKYIQAANHLYRRNEGIFHSRGRGLCSGSECCANLLNDIPQLSPIVVETNSLKADMCCLRLLMPRRSCIPGRRVSQTIVNECSDVYDVLHTKLELESSIVIFGDFEIGKSISQTSGCRIGAC